MQVILLPIFAAFMKKSADADQHWMARCFELARRGLGHVSPNPPVGAVLVYDNRILGEGFHSYFGGLHAEVDAFRNVRDGERHLIPEAILYVSLEPCCITGKTPPCTELILREGVKDVRIGTLDPNPDVAGKSIQLLNANGINVTTGMLEEEALDLITPFKKNILFKQPYVILKWAQSKFGYIGLPNEKIWLSHPYTNTWTHKQRSIADAILVGARTVMLDDPALTTRDYPGRSPHRVIYDPNNRLKAHYKVFNDDGNRVYYFSGKENDQINGNHIIKNILNDTKTDIDQILDTLFAHQIGILLVEGGAYVHNLFIQQNKWDEAWSIQTSHTLNQGINAANVKGKLIEKLTLGSDTIVGILNQT